MDLKHYLFENEITATEFASRVKASTAHIGLIRRRKLIPSLQLAERIILEAEGMITPQDIFPQLYEALEKAKNPPKRGRPKKYKPNPTITIGGGHGPIQIGERPKKEKKDE